MRTIQRLIAAGPTRFPSAQASVEADHTLLDITDSTVTGTHASVGALAALSS
jgi:hypothetical protein